MLTADARFRQLNAIALRNVFALERLNLPVTILPAVVSVADAVLFLAYFSISILLFLRKSNDRLALFTSVMLACMAAAIARPGDAMITISSFLRLPYLLVIVAGFLSVCTFLYLFPNASFTPRWTLWIALFWNALIIGYHFLASTAWPPQAEPMWLVLGWLGIGLGLQIYRYWRRSTPAQRQQTKWVLFGLLSGAIGFLSFNYLAPLASASFFEPGLTRVLYVIVGVPLLYLSFISIPVAFAFSILRYRLWDVDRIAYRAVIYGALTLGLALMYFGSVLVLQQWLRNLIGSDSVWAVVISTIAIALLFSPLRQRAQALIDLRTYHRRYDATQTLAKFSMVARHEVDLDVLTSELLSSVSEAMQPEHVSLWLKKR